MEEAARSEAVDAGSMYFESRFALGGECGFVGEAGGRLPDCVVAGWNRYFCCGYYPLRCRNLGLLAAGKHTLAVGGEPAFGKEKSRGGRLLF